MAELLNTAQGSVPGDVEQIRTAIFGREVRASIAEALELLYAGQTLEDGSTAKDQLTTLLENIYNIGVHQDLSQIGADHKLYMHYADGTTSIDAYNAGATDVVYKGRRYIINENGTLTPYLVQENENLDFDKLHCGYKYRIRNDGTITSILLFDQNADKISADENGERCQGCCLYNGAGLIGFVTDLENDTKVYLSDLLNRISTLESEVESLRNSVGGA